MPEYDYKLLLTGDNEDPVLSDLQLPFSSINYNLTETGGISFSCTIEGADYSSGIASRSNGVLELYYKLATESSYTLLMSATLSKIVPRQTSRAYTIELSGEETEYTFTQAASEIDFDGITSGYSLEDGSASFTTPVHSVYYVPGQAIEYDSIQYGIGAVSFSMSATSPPSWTLTEGDPAPLTGDNTVSAITLTDGVPYSGALGFGSSGYKYPATIYYPDAFSTPAISFDGYYCRGGNTYIFMTYFNFTLVAESDIELSISGLFTDLYIDDPTYDAQLGFELVLANGEFGTTPARGFIIYDPLNNFKLSSSGTNKSITATLPAGTYTARPLNIASKLDAAINYTIQMDIV